MEQIIYTRKTPWRDELKESLKNHREILSENQFGYWVSEDLETGRIIPFVCGCGGSGYLCIKHAMDLREQCIDKSREPVGYNVDLRTGIPKTDTD